MVPKQNWNSIVVQTCATFSYLSILQLDMNSKEVLTKVKQKQSFVNYFSSTNEFRDFFLCILENALNTQCVHIKRMSKILNKLRQIVTRETESRWKKRTEMVKM